MRGEYGGPKGEQNWGTQFKTPKESIKKKERKHAEFIFQDLGYLDHYGLL